MKREMPEIDWKEESQRFDGVAELYDAFRPSYPNDLIETIISVSNIPAGGRILEIGSGTGQATAVFAERGYSILCIEPGRRLTAIAAKKFHSAPNVEFERVRFEEWVERPNEFDLVMSAQAFHWVPKDIGYRKAACALKPAGCLALCWNRYPGLGHELRAELDVVYRERAPGLSAPIENVEEVIRKTVEEINESGCFEPALTDKFPWSARYSAHQYLGLLNTYSDHLRLGETERKSLFAGIADVIERHGGQIEMPYLAVLYMARRKSSA